MDAKAGRSQTTLGVWLGVTKSDDKNVLVLDVEGTDSKERGEDHVIFERKTSLLSLAVSEILIINLWVHDIGRFEGANYGLLKIVLELNLQLFQTSGKNKQLLLFIIREHSEEDSPLEKLAETLKNDMRTIWKSIAKPSQFEDSTVEDFFDFDFVPLPSKKYQEALFKESVDKLRTRFLDKSSENPFLTKEYKKDVPSDGFARYLSELWGAIQENKELNLPSQKQMLSIYRCEQIGKEAYDEIKNLMEEFENEYKEKSKIVGFRNRALDAVQKALEYYDENASRYDKEISNSKRLQLLQKLNDELYKLYEAQMNNIRKKVNDTFEKDISSKIDEKKPTKDFVKVVNEIKDSCVEKFIKKIDEITIKYDGFSDWNVKRTQNELTEEFNTKVHKLKERQLSLLLEKSYKSFEHHFDRKIRSYRDSRTLDTNEIWTLIRNEYNDKLNEINDALDEHIKDLQITDNLSNYKSKVNSQVYDVFVDLFKNLAKDAYILTEDVFTNIFTRRENGLPRRWSFGDNVEKEFVKAKNQSLKMLDILSIIRLKEDDMVHSWFIEDKERNIKLRVEVPEIPEDIIAIPYDECTRHINHFSHRTESELRRALSDQENASSRKYPLIVAIVMFLIFGWDETKMILTNPILFFFTSLLLGALYVAYKLDLFPYIIKTVLVVKDQVLSQMIQKEKQE